MEKIIPRKRRSNLYIYAFFWKFEQKPDPFEIFDAKKLQAAQIPLNNDSLGTREQQTAQIEEGDTRLFYLINRQGILLIFRTVFANKSAAAKKSKEHSFI